MKTTDHEKLVSKLKAIKGGIPDWKGRAWVSDKPALCILGCVLSLNRNWDAMVLPRLEKFEREHAEICSATDLQQILKKQGPVAFLANSLNIKHESRAEMLAAVTNWMVTISGHGSCEEQLINLQAWASSAKPSDLEKIDIHGFKLAGFQFMRMVLGADTVKPDMHIINFVSEAVGRKVYPKDSIEMLEKAAREMGMSVRSIDQKLWRIGARNEI